jgi:hypothetical protein
MWQQWGGQEDGQRLDFGRTAIRPWGSLTSRTWQACSFSLRADTIGLLLHCKTIGKGVPLLIEKFREEGSRPGFLSGYCRGRTRSYSDDYQSLQYARKLKPIAASRGGF